MNWIRSERAHCLEAYEIDFYFLHAEIYQASATSMWSGLVHLRGGPSDIVEEFSNLTSRHVAEEHAVKAIIALSSHVMYEAISSLEVDNKYSKFAVRNLEESYNTAKQDAQDDFMTACAARAIKLNTEQKDFICSYCGLPYKNHPSIGEHKFAICNQGIVTLPHDA